MTPTLLASLLLVLGATTAQAALQHAPAVHNAHAAHGNRRVVGGHLQNAVRAPAPQTNRHDYLLRNTTLAPKVQSRDSKGRATFYHPATEGGAQSSCGAWMNDNTMGVALSTPGWKYFADQGIDQQELCYKAITIHGILGDQQAKIFDECPTDSATNTCGNICDIDLTYGLFGMVAQHDLGIFPVTWSFDDGTPSPCGPAGSPSSSKSSKSSSATPTSSSSSSTAAHKSAGAHLAHKASSSSGGAASQASNAPKTTYSTQLQWWDDIDPQWCPGIQTPDGTITAAVGPSDTYPNDKLAETCGKWITINADNKQVQAQVVEYVPNTAANFLAVGTAFQSITTSGSGSVTWGWNN